MGNPIFCPRCGSGNVVSYGRMWKCKECSRYFLKVLKKKQKNWHQWNKGLTKETDERVRAYGIKQSNSKRNNPDFIRKAIENLPPAKIHVSKEELEEMYKTMTQKDIAVKLDCCQGRICQLMRELGLKTRSTARFHPHKMS